MKVIKNDLHTEEFDSRKIYKGIVNAMRAGSGIYLPKIAKVIEEDCIAKFKDKEEINIKEIDKFVLKKLVAYGQSLTASAYDRYKTLKKFQQQEGIIDDDIYGIIDGTNEKEINENSNKDARMISTQRDLIAGTASRSFSERKIMPTYLLNAHNDGLIHIHDTDYMMNKGMFNCMLINLKDMLDNGTVINGKMIETPKSFKTACTVATQISLQVANGQYGGQTFSVSHLAPYVRVSYNKWVKHFTKELSIEISKEEIEKLAYKETLQEIKDGVQTIQFQENTFSSNNGQTPFVSIFMYLNEDKEYIKETALIIEEMLNQRYKGMKNEYGVSITPAFPKLLYVLDENNVPQDSEYRYLTDLAVKCASKRMNPDFISAKIMKEQFDDNVFPCMGCRSFLSPWKDGNGNYKFYGRFNRGVVTINLVDVALSAQGDMERFWDILEERLELCKDALILKDKLLRGAKAEVSPIHWLYGAIGRLNKGETIDKFLKDGYSSISLGYIGVYEMVKVMIGDSNTSEKGSEFAYQVMKHLEDKTIEWRSIDGLHGCSLYGTPSESLCYKFAQKTQNRFGVISDITDKEWFTNSYHVNVMEAINAFDKLAFESRYQKLSKGGAVSYIEVPNMDNNLEALSEVVDFMYNTIQYAEINTRNGDSCGNCGYTGEIGLNKDDEWECPQCHCTDKNKLTVVRRTCGYIGSSWWNKGKTQEINKRVLHL
jgi:ribonucleoside-triphosphate reductase (formate)